MAAVLAALTSGCGRDPGDGPPVSVEHVYELGTKVEFGLGGDSERFRTTGWQATESGGVWTSGSAASMVFRPRTVGVPLLLALNATGLIKSGELPFQPVTVYANSHKIATWRVSGERVYTTVIPAEFARGELLLLDLHIPSASSPAALGTGADPRRLGLFCKDLTMSIARADQSRAKASPKSGAGQAQPYALDTFVSCGKSGDAEAFQTSGWAAPEETFTWTDGERAGLVFGLCGAQGALTLRVHADGMCSPPRVPVQRVTVSANNRPIAEWQVGAAGDFEAVIPADIVAAGNIVAIEFKLPDAISPRDLGLSSDARRLGLQVFGFELTSELAER